MAGTEFPPPGRQGSSFGLAIMVIATVLLAYPISLIVYNLFFHPLSRYPGPPLWAAFRLPSLVSLWRGNLVHDTFELHQRLGDIVRIAPNEISVAHPDGWRDIYANRPGHKPFPKNPIWWGGKSTGRPESIINAEDPADHERMRRLLDHGFTPRALKAQEPIIQSYVELLITKLKAHAAVGGAEGVVLDIVRWYNFTTFDIVGDLGFGEPFDCLKTSDYHPWVATIFTHFKLGTLMASTRFYPLISEVIMKFIPKEVMQRALENRKLAAEKVHRRLNLETERSDFMSPIIKFNDERGMTVPEIEGTFNIVIVAGSETTGTVLSGITSYLTRRTQVWNTLALEIRSRFKEAEEMTFETLAELPYLNAVIKEGLRMCPPTPAGLPRLVPKGGDTVCGNWFPGDTHISLHQWSTYRSVQNFHRPSEFVPDRWLPAAASDSQSPYYHDKRYAVQNFSLGPRNCIGKNLAWAEMRLILAQVVFAFDIYGVEGMNGKENVEWEDQKTWILVEKVPHYIRLVVARKG